ncbi:FAD-dependent oxidoreductase [Pseudomaricurvus alcaniphilus]|uniref:FAD-dependent oxidoreductase n=1 Tax=Pseudomaricurvus alcaniphilus TaxID=1166482 RepID=UPI00140738B5|nr:FAD-dependent oxidoreductase [Pseudomaricurvus alcaniphilus]NHN36552.1 FAD-dependent oxidoreductase [Pseudomaricurvus alcaniphilus]
MIETDLLVLGSGAGGLSAAITAACLGCKVTVVEKTEYFGGTTALSGGAFWIPNNPYMTREDSTENARKYLQAVIGDNFDDNMVSAFLANAPEMIDFLEKNTEAMRFWSAEFMPDYEPQVECSSFGRSMSVPHFDASELGVNFDKLRPALKQLTVFNGMQVDAVDLGFLMNYNKSFSAFLYTTKLVLRYAFDWLRSRRGRVLKGGNAVAARLLKASMDAGVTLIDKAPARKLIEENGRVVGAIVQIDNKEVEIRASKGVVIATGGFAQNEKMVAEYIPFPEHHKSMLPEGNVGEGLELGMSVGGELGSGLSNNGCWTPVSVRKHADGSETRYPHIFLDRSRPGSILVNQSGRRFANEATHYQALVAAIQRTGSVPCWLIGSRSFISKYGLGLALPYMPVSSYVRDGYLIEGQSVSELAAKLGIDGQALEETFAQVNSDAALGKDSLFARGDSVYDQVYGDPGHKPNPNFGAMGEGPYYAVKIVPGDLGTFVGLKTDNHAQVLRDGMPIPGLYAAGLDANTVMGGEYPGAGCSIGPALTFGYMAAKHACNA